MTVKSFEMDDRAGAVFAALKKVFDVKTDAAVVERALSLAQIAGDIAGNDGVITLDGAGGKKRLTLNQ